MVRPPSHILTSEDAGLMRVRTLGACTLHRLCKPWELVRGNDVERRRQVQGLPLIPHEPIIGFADRQDALDLQRRTQPLRARAATSRGTRRQVVRVDGARDLAAGGGPASGGPREGARGATR